MTIKRVTSAATTNSTLVAAGKRRLDRIALTNVAVAAKFIKFYDKATAPTVGTDVPIATFGIPASGNLHLTGLRVYTILGLGFAITGAAPDADTTATAVGDINGIIDTNSATA